MEKGLIIFRSYVFRTWLLAESFRVLRIDENSSFSTMCMYYQYSKISLFSQLILNQ